MEMENACLRDLNHTEINVGSAHAARAIRMRSRGIGERSEKRMNETPETVSGKELMAALVDVHIGRQLPSELMPFIMLISILYGLTGPVMRAWWGAYGRDAHEQVCGRRPLYSQRHDVHGQLQFCCDVRLALQEAV